MSNGMPIAGIFHLRNKAAMGAMPVHNPSGLWQAWKTPDQHYVVRPLDRNERPWGTTYMLEAQEFGSLLTCAVADALEKLGRADDPDILSRWYEEALADQRGKEAESHPAAAPGVDSHGERQAGSKARSLKKGRLSPNEAILEPAWNPDDFFAGDERPDMPAGTTAIRLAELGRARLAAASGMDAVSVQAARKAEPERAPAATSSGPDGFDDDLLADALAQGRMSPDRPLDFLPDLSLEAEAGRDPLPPTRPGSAGVERRSAGQTTAKGADSRRQETDGGSADAGSRNLERQMRKEFEFLLTHFENGFASEAERALSGLIARDADFSMEQKFMFTEFGLALKRKGLPALALACHKRALAIAPSDEHVLFNVARSEFDRGNVGEARQYLLKALETVPTFDAAGRFLAFLDGGAKKV